MPNKRARRDRRYAIAREYCGFQRPRHVVRFCDSYIGAARSLPKAFAIARQHAAARASTLRPSAPDNHICVSVEV